LRPTRATILNISNPETLSAVHGVALVLASHEDCGDVLAAVIVVEEVDGGLGYESLRTSSVSSRKGSQCLGDCRVGRQSKGDDVLGNVHLEENAVSESEAFKNLLLFKLIC
jgi:hypothetical protein